MGDGGADFAAAYARLRAAMAAVAMGDVGPIKDLHSKAHDVTSFYGWGGYEKGWDAVSKRWDWAAGQFEGGTVSHENLTTLVSADLAVTTDIETFHARRPGGADPIRWTNRVTHVFRREDGTWRLVHRHANRLEGNPLG